MAEESVVKLEKKGAWEIKLDTVLKDIRGKDVVQDGVPFTLGDACLVALDTGIPSGAAEGLKPKLKRARIIDKIMAAQEIGKGLVLPSEETTLIKERVGEMIGSAYIVQQICTLLDPVRSDD